MKHFVLYRKHGITSVFRIMRNGDIAVGRSYLNRTAGDRYNQQEGMRKALIHLEVFLKKRVKSYWTKYKRGTDKANKPIVEKGHQLFVRGTVDMLHPEEQAYYNTVILKRLSNFTAKMAKRNVHNV